MADHETCDTLVVGGGSSGAVLAARLSEDAGQTVILVEAGPDFGPLSEGRWPSGLLDGSGKWSIEAEWGFWNQPSAARESFPVACGKVIGGSSSINAGGFNWPGAADLDEWAAAGNPRWSPDRLFPIFRGVEADPDAPGSLHGRSGPMPIARTRSAPLSPFFAAFEAASQDSGYGWVDDINDPYAGKGIARRARNTREGKRWNAAFAYLDPARGRRNLTILDRTTVHALHVAGGRVLGALVETPIGRRTIGAGRVVLAAGAYNSPAILMRSGLGPEDHLKPLGIAVSADLPGVGAHLRDHPVVATRVLLTEALSRSIAAASRDHPLAPWQVVLRGAGPACPRDTFDFQLAPSGEAPVEDGWETIIRLELMKPRSTGSVRLRSADPVDAPSIDSAFLSDPEGQDVDTMLHALATMRDLVRTPPLRDAVARERLPGPNLSQGDIVEALRANAYSYHHPCGTCRMGPASDATAVVDETGAVHGVRGLFVADASIMPMIPRTPLNFTCIAAAEHIAAMLAGGDR